MTETSLGVALRGDRDRVVDEKCFEMQSQVGFEKKTWLGRAATAQIEGVSLREGGGQGVWNGHHSTASSGAEGAENGDRP